jgi:tRNA A-37 threonylcarbamoyl transferase component Bud32
MSMSDSVRWLLANAELDRVLEQSSEARAAHLASLRARDAALAADVEALLAEHHALDAAGLLTASSAGVAMQTSDLVQAGSAPPPGSWLSGGSVLGPYRVVRPLGRGGMGAVYEADEIDSGRRVALKVLKERLHDPRERERFNREGRLAASLNHPHCVFVFAASEVDGRLAIAMELMQGTLADRLKTHGPLPPAEAVDAALQLISGLDAAAAIGILHRDVKPSNCFVSADGVIKIGDFGISRSLRPTEETAFSTRTRFAATPAYASPEQLRGAALDTRADIYSLGATLYELLTGRPPFERDDLMALLMAVANDAPQPPHARERAVPPGLSQVVLRCLAKQPEQRFADYDALAAALEPYASTAPTPATLTRRFFAGFIDQSVLTCLAALVMVWWMGPAILSNPERFAGPGDPSPPFWRVAWFLGLLAYYGIAESVWAATPGKALVGLTLVDANGRAPHASRVLARAALFATVLSGDALGAALDPNGRWLWLHSLAVLSWGLLAVVFSTARRRNGYAGWHDLATTTRIVERKAPNARSAVVQATPPAAIPETVAWLGPFRVSEGSVPGIPVGWRPGFDDRLRRSVWIRQVPPGTPPIEASRLAVSRPTRLRWLAGRREPRAAWDAFEAVPGLPLEQACVRTRPWAEVLSWLLDLARECAAQTPEDRPRLAADRVWILDGGGAKLVDDPTADLAANAALSPPSSCATLLLDVVRTARGSPIQPWPLSALRFIDHLRTDPPPSHAAVVGELESLARRRAVLTRGWRAAHTLPLAAVLLLTVGLTGLRAVENFTVAAAREPLPPDLRVVAYLLDEHSDGELGLDRGIGDLSPLDMDAIEVVLASRYRHVLTDPRLLTMAVEFNSEFRSGRSRIQWVLRREPTDAEARRAIERPYVQTTLRDQPYVKSGLRAVRLAGEFAILGVVRTLVFVVFLSLVTAVVFRGGLMRAVGLELVIDNGRPASRLRVLARTVIVWAPIIVTLVIVRMTPSVTGVAIWVPALLVLLAGAIVTILRPERGIQDRLAGTWIVPR